MKVVLKNVNLPLAEFQLEVNLELGSRITVLFGPSGAGKTSLLEVVAGLRRPKTAFIQLGDEILTDTSRRLFVPVHQRQIGYLPQDLALFPHLTVRQNLLYGHSPEGKNHFGLDLILELLDIRQIISRRVPELSGGEKQRVALARALLAAPRLLLLDEPLSHLDAALKSRLIPYFRRIRDEFEIPMIYVTHDRSEALTLADDVAVIQRGRVLQTGRVDQVFSQPASAELAGILGVETVHPGKVLETREGLVSLQVGEATLTAVDPDFAPGTVNVLVCIRAEDVILLKGGDAPSSPRNHLRGKVTTVSREGTLIRIGLDCGFPLHALLTRQAGDEMALAPGSSVVALVKAPNVHLIPR